VWTDNTATIANSTFTGNTSDSSDPQTGSGALVLSQPGNGSGIFNVFQTTISGNSSNGVVAGLGIAHLVGNPQMTVNLYGSIVSGNSGASDLGATAILATGSPADDQFTLNAGHNVIGSVRANTPLNDVVGNQLGVTDPKLGPLADNGGMTKTMALLAGSPAIDAGGSTVRTFPGNQFDQRGAGFDRLSGSALDIGAVELQAPTLTGVAPATGSTVGGTTITLTGTDFVAGMTVTVGGVACTNVTVLSATSATCVTPGGTAGAADVAIDVSGLTATLPGSFTYEEPASTTTTTAGDDPVVPEFTG
jgi:hypothetical protein